MAQEQDWTGSGVTPDEAIIGYLLRTLAEDRGSYAEVVKGVGMHAYVNTEPWDPDAAKASSGAAKKRARALMGEVGS